MKIGREELEDLREGLWSRENCRIFTGILIR